MANPHSTARIAGHPIHPMLILFPIAFFVAVLAYDLAFWQTANAFWAGVAMLLLSAGIIMAALAAIAGLTDMIGEPDPCLERDLAARRRQCPHCPDRAMQTVSTLQPGAGWCRALWSHSLIGCRRHAHFYWLEGWEMVYRGRVGVSEEAEGGAKEAAPHRPRHAR